MEKSRIERINELARKAKQEGLTPEETAERDKLRKEYLAAVRESVVSQLDRVYFVDSEGHEEKLKKKK
jgi:uncharacterized protein YnzC (UPF0291/DUF896 family)